MEHLQFIPLTNGESFTYGLLTVAILSIWVSRRGESRLALVLPSVLFLLALLSAHVHGYVDFVAIASIALFIFGFFLLRQSRHSISFGGTLIIIVLSIGFMFHKLPGFHNPAIIQNVTFTEDSVPYSLYLNFDKAIIGFFFLLLGTRILQSFHDLKISLKHFFLGCPLIAAVLLVGSLLLGYVRVSPKFGPFFIEWVWVNLFFTCLAEEAFFRGIVQNLFVQSFKNKRFGFIYALVLAALLFGIAHYAGGWKYILLATLAGLGYGIVYHRSRHIEASVFTHFTVNTIHFIFFTYPALARTVA